MGRPEQNTTTTTFVTARTTVRSTQGVTGWSTAAWTATADDLPPSARSRGFGRELNGHLLPGDGVHRQLVVVDVHLIDNVGR